MYINNQQNHNIDQNTILKRFQRGEITIAHAFKLLTELTDDKREDHLQAYRYQVKSKMKVQEDNAQINQDNLTKSLAELDQLVGLNHVKELIKEYIAFLKVQNLRRQYDLKAQSIVMHMVFKGNPGTGKTTIARIIGKIFKELGFLETGELIEAERADLVGEYIGHTAQKTKKLIQKALGGVLFIDEAYSLARGDEKDFGKEAIDTMVKAMEDHKDNLIIILAGYRNEMEFFLETNPGLRSRFAIHLDFPDYTIDELVKIAKLMFAEREYILSKESKYYIYRVLTYLRNQEGITSGNARTVRNLIEKAIRHQARRIIEKTSINRQDLITIEKEDLAWGVFKDD